MCNPRRIEVSVGRELAEAWEHEVRRVATRSTDATGEARVREPLDATIGAPTLRMLERVLAGAEGWERVGDTFRHALDGGYLAYHGDSRELEIVAQATDLVAVEVTAATVLRGQLQETIEATGVGKYYDDEWDGVTEDDARQVAHREAEVALEVHRQALLDTARTTAEAQRADDLDAAAGAQADAELARRSTARAQDLRAEAAAQLTAVGIQGRNIFHQALAQAYRDAILAYARLRGAERVSCTERDGVLEIEFDLQA